MLYRHVCVFWGLNLCSLWCWQSSSSGTRLTSADLSSCSPSHWITMHRGIMGNNDLYDAEVTSLRVTQTQQWKTPSVITHTTVWNYAHHTNCVEYQHTTFTAHWTSEADESRDCNIPAEFQSRCQSVKSHSAGETVLRILTSSSVTNT